MKIHGAAVLALALASHIASTTSMLSIRNHMSVFLCAHNQTVAVQILTKRNEDEVSCQCQAGPTRDPSIREDYVYTPGIGSHKLHTNAENWNEARKICNEENAHLAIINSKTEEAKLVDMLKKSQDQIRGGLNTEQALLGIHDQYAEGDWVTVFGEPLYATGFSEWSPTYFSPRGQPDNMGGIQHCGALVTIGGMDDVYCQDHFAFFCEMPSTC